MKKHLFNKVFAISFILLLSLLIFSSSFCKQTVKYLQFHVETVVAYQELSPSFVWFHPRAAAIPGYGEGGNPAVIMTIQKHLVVSDFYSGMYFMRTDDLGETWSQPFEIPELAWQYEADGTTVSVADVTPLWHEKSGKLIAIGIKVRYNKEGKQVFDKPRSHDAAYTLFDPETNSWTPWKMVENIPDPNSKFYLVNPGCVQWLVKPNGNILLPVYFSGSDLGKSSVSVLECTFDGSTLTYLQHGSELTVDEGRGFGEPSLALYNDTYFLTIRNDIKAYVSTSKDGLNWDLPISWKFDDGQELGSYNTQAHWLVHSGGLFLTYTRKGADNDHIARNRAPIFIAQVNPKNLTVIRSTEQVLIPERGVMLGNFGASAITENESWVTDAEFMIGNERHPRGADGSVWIGKVNWAEKNKMLE